MKPPPRGWLKVGSMMPVFIWRARFDWNHQSKKWEAPINGYTCEVIIARHCRPSSCAQTRKSKTTYCLALSSPAALRAICALFKDTTYLVSTMFFVSRPRVFEVNQSYHAAKQHCAYKVLWLVERRIKVSTIYQLNKFIHRLVQLLLSRVNPVFDNLVEQWRLATSWRYADRDHCHCSRVLPGDPLARRYALQA